MFWTATLLWSGAAFAETLPLPPEESQAIELAADNVIGPWSIGVVIGRFDVDTDDGDDPHLNEVSYGLMLGYQPSRYWAIDAELTRVEIAREYDNFGVLTAFGANGLGLSGRLMWPLADDFLVYLRAGVYAFDLDEDSELRDEPLDDSWTQPVFGAGVRGQRWFFEYVNYGDIDGLFLEQLRAGFELRF